MLRRTAATALVAHDPDPAGHHSLAFKEREQRIENHIPAEDPIIFLEVTVTDASEFSTKLQVHGTIRNGRRVLTMSSPVVANSIAALLLHLGRHTEALQAYDRAIDVQMHRLRRLLESDPTHPRYLQTVWGVGYVFVPDGIPNPGGNN